MYESQLWKLDGKCAKDKALFLVMRLTGIDPFFDLPQAETKEFMKKYCSDCPVRLQCLSYANRHEPPGGWGGLTSNQRKRLVRQQKNEFAKLQERMKELLRDGPDTPIAS